MKANTRTNLAIVLRIAWVVLLIVFIVSGSKGTFGLICVGLLLAGAFGIGLLDNLKEGLRTGFAYLEGLLVLGGIAVFFKTVLKAGLAGSIILGLAAGGGVGYPAYKWVLPKLLKIKQNAGSEATDSEDRYGMSQK